jgi:hypothetical protein
MRLREFKVSKFKEYMAIVNEAEMSLKANPKLVEKALAKAQKENNDHVETLIKGLNPKKLSVADIDMLNDFLGQ